MEKLKERRLPDPRLPEKEELSSRAHRWAIHFSSAPRSAAPTWGGVQHPDHLGFDLHLRPHADRDRPRQIRGGVRRHGQGSNRDGVRARRGQLSRADGLRRPRVAPYRRQGSLPADGARLVHELCDLVHAGLPARHRRGGALLALRPGRPLRRKGCEPHRGRGHHLLAGNGLRARHRLRCRYRFDRRNQSSRGLGESGDRSRPLRGIARLFRDVGFHAQAREGGVPQFQDARPDIDAWPDGARGHRHRRGRRRALCAAAEGRFHRLRRLLRALLLRGDARNRQPCARAVWAFSRRRCSRASADRATSCWRRC